MRDKQIDSDIILTKINGKRVLVDAFSIAAVQEGIFARTVILKAGANDNDLKGREIKVKEDLKPSMNGSARRRGSALINNHTTDIKEGCKK